VTGGQITKTDPFLLASLARELERRGGPGGEPPNPAPGVKTTRGGNYTRGAVPASKRARSNKLTFQKTSGREGHKMGAEKRKPARDLQQQRWPGGREGWELGGTSRGARAGPAGQASVSVSRQRDPPRGRDKNCSGWWAVRAAQKKNKKAFQKKKTSSGGKESLSGFGQAVQWGESGHGLAMMEKRIPCKKQSFLF